ncbi:MAG: hypothetical protein AB1454_15180, partial [Candidatus Auribacterota bacterium]
MKRLVLLLLLAGCFAYSAGVSAATFTINTKVTRSIKNDSSVFSVYSSNFYAVASTPGFYLGWQRGICEFDLSSLYNARIPAGSIQSITLDAQFGGVSSRSQYGSNYFDLYKLQATLADGVIQGTEEEFYGYGSIIFNKMTPDSVGNNVITNYILPDIIAGTRWTGLFLKEDETRETFVAIWSVTLTPANLIVQYDEHWAWIYNAGETFAQDWTEAEISQLTELWDTSGDSIEIDGETWYYTNDDEL